MPPDGHSARARKGSGLLIITVLLAALTATISLWTVKVSQAVFHSFDNSKIIHQAQQYALTEAEILKATNYENLEAHNKVDIQNSNGFLSELQLSGEFDYSEYIKGRSATINIYYGEEGNPRYSLNIIRTSIEPQESGGVPIGTIIAWPSSTAPTEGGTWLLCNGDGFSSATYPKLYVVLKSTTLPSLNGRFLEGTTEEPKSYKSAGLPNITGTGPKFNLELWTPTNTANHNDGAILKGSSYGETQKTGTNDDNRAASYGWNFDASKSNAIYGASNTVQPASYTVRYYIKAS